MKTNTWSWSTLLLHFGMAATVTAQLMTSLVMDSDPGEGGAIAHAAFTTHEMLGLVALAIILLHWVSVSLPLSKGELSHLFPLDSAARQKVLLDIKGLFVGRLPKGGKRGGLPGLIQGLGLLAVTAAAISGGVLYLLMPEAWVEEGVLFELFEEVHEGLAAGVWAYWLVHVSMAVIHWFVISDSVQTSRDNTEQFKTVR